MAQRQFTLRLSGHVVSKKNSREIHRAGRGGKPFIGKSAGLRAYEASAEYELRRQWNFPTLTGPVKVQLIVGWWRNHPDALGPAETLYDALEHAEVVNNDRQLVPWGEPAIARVHVSCPEEEGATIILTVEEPDDANG
jgi:Holliday junction resolvase RusA-like endonuclease